MMTYERTLGFYISYLNFGLWANIMQKAKAKIGKTYFLKYLLKF